MRRPAKASIACVRGGAAVLVAVCGLVGAGCTEPRAPTEREPGGAGVAPEILPFIHDDYPAALTEARRRHKPLFVDAWAPWCHSCLSMKEFALRDPALLPIADRFVWLTIDTDDARNADFVRRFPGEVWPTLWVIDAERQEPVLRWGGTATGEELRLLLQSVVPTNDTVDVSSDGVKRAKALAAFRRGNALASTNARDDAVKELREAHALADDELRPRALEALVSLLSSSGDPATCAELARNEGPRLAPSSSRATVLATGLACAAKASRAEDVAALRTACLEAARDKDPRVLIDDRSGLFESVVELDVEAGRADDARAIAEEWSLLLEQAAARASTPSARAVFDPHRTAAYLALHRPEKAIALLTARERELPNDYNPPARLARAYLEAGRAQEAEAAAKRAANKVEGPRSLRVHATLADVEKRLGNVAGERHALAEALRKTETSPLTPSQAAFRKTLADRLAALPK